MGKESIFSIIKKTLKSWSLDDAFSHSAAIAFYSILSLPGLIFVIVYFVGIFLGRVVVREKIVAQVSNLLGQEIAGFVQDIINNSMDSNQSKIALYVGLVILIISATAVFIELQKVLNKIWKVTLKKTREAGIKALIFHRLISLGLIILIGILFLVSVISASTLAVLKDWISSVISGELTLYIIYGLSLMLLFLTLCVLFAMIYKFMPDAKIAWKAVRVGSTITTFLFLLGALGLKFYFSLMDPTSTYGVAGSVVLILIWAYYSSMVFLLGAEFTKVYALSFTEGIKPIKYSKYVSDC